jgi:hypothetical protein
VVCCRGVDSQCVVGRGGNVLQGGGSGVGGVAGSDGRSRCWHLSNHGWCRASVHSVLEGGGEGRQGGGGRRMRGGGVGDGLNRRPDRNVRRRRALGSSMLICIECVRGLKCDMGKKEKWWGIIPPI